MGEIPIFVVDAFVGEMQGRILRGNPAAVALLNAPREDGWMQEVAAEMNLSETAFLVPKEGANFGLRWFTPTTEVKLCGHATLASAHVLWESGRLDGQCAAHFETLSGILTAQKRGGEIALDFPAQESKACEMPTGLRKALGLERCRAIKAFRAGDDLLIEMHEADVENLRADFPVLQRICEQIGVRGLIATGPAERPTSSSYDFISRFLAPCCGIDEDPVTGSAHTKLAPFWGARWGKTQMIGYQASPRGGLVKVNWQGQRVELLGRAQTRLRGYWLD